VYFLRKKGRLRNGIREAAANGNAVELARTIQRVEWMNNMWNRCVKFMFMSATLATLLAVHTWPAFAQTAGSGTITGTITDPSGSIVSAASVLVRNTDTGIERTLSTNDAGIYYATFLQPGHYEVEASKEGFAKVLHKELILQVGETIAVNFALPLKTSEVSVTVTGELPLIDPDKTETSQVVSQNLVENLPIAGRRWDNFVLLTPGVTNDGGNGLVSYRGISGLYNGNSVDGANNNQAFFSEARGRTTVPYVYSMDSIKEFQVSESNYSAEFGQAAGGQVNAVTKSGGNAVHGDLFYYLRYPTLNALDPINKFNGVLTQPIHQQQQFGGSVGGSIIKDKLFYYFTYDGSRKVFPVVYTSSQQAYFGALGTNACPTGATAAQCTAAASYLQSLTGAFARTASQDIYFGKLDYQANAANHFSIAYDMDNFRSPNSYNTGTTVNNNSVTANGKADTHERFVTGSWSSTLSANTVNEFRFQWSRDLEVIGANAAGPSITLSNISAYGMPNALPRPAFPDEHRYQFTDIVSSVKGTHTFKWGVDINLIHELLINLFQGGGIYSYSSTSAASKLGAPCTSAGPAGTYSASTASIFCEWVADVYGVPTTDGLAGKHYTSFTQVTDPITGVGKDDFFDNDVAAFFEDTWKIRRNLTLNLGLRYDVQMVPQPYKPATFSPLTTAVSSSINIDKNNFGPRIGVAWQPLRNTTVRAGYGMFYGKTSNSTFYAIRVENGVYQQQFVCGPTAACGPAFPNVIFTPPGPPLAAPFTGALTPQVINTNPPLGTLVVHGLSPDFVNPLVHEGELGVERQLPWNSSLSVTYVFSRALHLPVFVDSNLAPATATKSYDIVDATGNTQFTNTQPFYTSRLFNQTGVVLTGYSVINSWYNGMIVTYRKPFSHGLEMLFNYTLSKAIDGGQVPGQFGTFYGTDSPLNPQSLKQENGLSDLDQRHRFVGSVVWTPTYFHGLANRVERMLLDGFSLSNIVTVASGQPVTGQISGFPSGGVDGGVTGGEVSNSAGPIGGRLPFLARNTFPGPGLRSVDFRISKQIVFTERLRLQLIGEAFNLFNHTNVNSVNTTSYFYDAPSKTNSQCYNGLGTLTAPVHANGCLVPNGGSKGFLSNTSTSDLLYGPRQLQISAKFFF
jgi:hypothetical protein